MTLRAIELLTQCFVCVYGRTVSVIGPFQGIQKVRTIVNRCMANIHPIYELKKLMVEKEISKNENLKNTQWNRFLPTFKRLKHNKNSKTLNQIKKNLANKKKKKYTPWPPEQTPSKIDIAMETGAYWNNEWRKENLRFYFYFFWFFWFFIYLFVLVCVCVC